MYFIVYEKSPRALLQICALQDHQETPVSAALENYQMKKIPMSWIVFLDIVYDS